LDLSCAATPVARTDPCIHPLLALCAQCCAFIPQNLPGAGGSARACRVPSQGHGGDARICVAASVRGPLRGARPLLRVACEACAPRACGGVVLVPPAAPRLVPPAVCSSGSDVPAHLEPEPGPACERSRSAKARSARASRSPTPAARPSNSPALSTPISRAARCRPRPYPVCEHGCGRRFTRRPTCPPNLPTASQDAAGGIWSCCVDDLPLVRLARNPPAALVSESGMPRHHPPPSQHRLSRPGG